MRTDDPNPGGPPLDRLRAGAGRARRWLADRGPVARVALLAAALGLLALAGYHANAPQPVEWIALYGGQAFPRENLADASTALDTAGIPNRAGGRRQLSVPADRKHEAMAALAKARVAIPSLKRLRDEPADAGQFFEGIGEREQRDYDRIARNIEIVVQSFPGIASADVLLNRYRARVGLSAPWETTAYIFLTGTDDRTIPPQTVERIRHLVETRVPYLRKGPDGRPDALTVSDPVQDYLVAGHPEVGVRSLAQARAEELRGEVLVHVERIDPAIRVSINPEPLAAAPAPPPAAAPPPEPLVLPNQPAELEPAPAPRPAAPAVPAAAGRFKVLVEVPNRYYLDAFAATNRGHSPAPEDLNPYRLRTEAELRRAVAHVVPAAELADLQIITLYQAAPPARPATAVAVGSAELWRARAWWLTVGLAGLSLTVLGAAVGRWVAWRRPSGRRPVATAVRRPHYDPADSSGPSDRVRELVRREPEAAAGVLNRWIHAGEPDR